MTDWLSADEVKALREQVLGFHTLLADTRRLVIRALDEIEERRRVEQDSVGDLVRYAQTQIAAKRERWLEDQAKSRGLTPVQLAERFSLEIRASIEVDDVGQTRFVERMRLIARQDGVS